MSKNIQKKTPVLRTSQGLRDALFDEIDAIRAGTSNPTKANAVAKLASTVVDTVRMEVEVRKMVEKAPAYGLSKDSDMGEPLKLGK